MSKSRAKNMSKVPIRKVNLTMKHCHDVLCEDRMEMRQTFRSKPKCADPETSHTTLLIRSKICGVKGLLDPLIRSSPSLYTDTLYRVMEKKVPSQFSFASSVRADGLCIGCPSQWAEVRRENSNMQEFFCMTLYTAIDQFNTYLTHLKSSSHHL